MKAENKDCSTCVFYVYKHGDENKMWIKCRKSSLPLTRRTAATCDTYEKKTKRIVNTKPI
jgi:hypothetical protein